MSVAVSDKLSSGDMIADRRYGYAQDLLKQGDYVAAADLFQQVLEIAPFWAAAWFGLGDALEKSGSGNDAAGAFRKALALAPDDAMGAGVRLARLGKGDAAVAMTPGYVAALFDQYADRFDMHLTIALAYQGPEIILKALQEVCAGEKRVLHFSNVMDLGCGTGLMAAAIHPYAGLIRGVDLSARMVGKARQSGFYEEVACGEMLAFVHAAQPSSSDLVIAADVLVYVSDLDALFAAVRRVLRPSGFFAFTLQSCEGEGYGLGEDLRYHHSAPYVNAKAAAADLALALCKPCITRHDAGRPVPGYVVVLSRRANAG